MIAFTLAGLVGMAQTNQPLPSGAVPFGATTYLSPLDSTIWLYKERDGTAIKVANWVDVDSLFGLGYTKAQVDSAITASLGDYLPLAGGTMSGSINMGNNSIQSANFYRVGSGSMYSQFGNGLLQFRSTVANTPSSITQHVDGGLIFNTDNGNSTGNSTTKLQLFTGNNHESINPNIEVAQFFGSVTGRMDGTSDPDGYESQFATQAYVDNNFVNTTGDQTGIGGKKAWVRGHTWTISDVDEPANTANTVQIRLSGFGVLINSWDTSGTEAFRFRTYGDVLDGSQLTLFIGGISANGAYINTSDSTIKNIVTYDYSAVDSLPARAFTYKDNRDSGRVHVGYIAQEVLEVLPDAVYQSEETGLLSVDHVQVLIAKLAMLEEKVKQLEARIEQLEN